MSDAEQTKIIVTISPIKRAQDLFALAHFMNHMVAWPCFAISSLSQEKAVFSTTKLGWQRWQQILEQDPELPLEIANIQDSYVNLHVMSQKALHQAFLQIGFPRKTEVVRE